ncbi:hypothetical protein H9L39_19931 [Fusarium oxysporum f. sp. albedinis]|nr:hypothetical protein H9L39_19931 [Fusarium oxysporum f. sp. albedinis]
MSNNRTPANEESLVAWITSNSNQTRAAKRYFDTLYGEPTRKAARDTNSYTLGKMGDDKVVLTELPEGEKRPPFLAAAEAVRDMMRTFRRIRIALFIGTGSGVRDGENDVRLGDVVVSTNGSFQFDHDASVKAMAFRGTGEVVQAPECVKTVAKELISRYQASTNALSRAISDITYGFPNQKDIAFYSRSGDEFDILYSPSFAHVEMDGEPCYVSCGNDKGKFKARPPPRGDGEDKAIAERATKRCSCSVGPPPQNSPLTVTDIADGNDKSGSVPQNTGYQELIGHFLKSEIDTAIRRDRKGLEAHLAKLVEANSKISGYGDRMIPLALELERFQTEWQITQPSLREGRKGAAGRQFETWQRMRQSSGLSGQTRFFSLQNEMLAFSNGAVLDKDIGYASLQRCLWSVWRVMEYLGLTGDVKSKS